MQLKSFNATQTVTTSKIYRNILWINHSIIDLIHSIIYVSFYCFCIMYNVTITEHQWSSEKTVAYWEKIGLVLSPVFQRACFSRGVTLAVVIIVFCEFKTFVTYVLDFANRYPNLCFGDSNSNTGNANQNPMSVSFVLGLSKYLLTEIVDNYLPPPPFSFYPPLPACLGGTRIL